MVRLAAFVSVIDFYKAYNQIREGKLRFYIPSISFAGINFHLFSPLPELPPLTVINNCIRKGDEVMRSLPSKACHDGEGTPRALEHHALSAFVFPRSPLPAML